MIIIESPEGAFFLILGANNSLNQFKWLSLLADDK